MSSFTARGAIILGKRVCHDEGEAGGDLGVDLSGLSDSVQAGGGDGEPRRDVSRTKATHLDGIGANLDLAPRDGLVRAGAGVAAVKLLGRVDVDGRLGAVAHEAGVCDVVLDEAAAEDDDAGALGADGEGVDAADVADDVDLELAGRGLEGVEVEHVAEAAVGQGRAEDGYVVLVGPVVDGALVVDLLAEAADDAGRGPDELVLGPAAGLLLLEHGVEDGHDPVLKGAVVLVGHDEVADAVEALEAEALAVGAEGGHVGVAEALDKVLLDAAGGGDDGRDVLVLDQVAQDAAEARRDEVGGVAEEDCRLVVGLGVPPGSLGGEVLVKCVMCVCVLDEIVMYSSVLMCACMDRIFASFFFV